MIKSTDKPIVMIKGGYRFVIGALSIGEDIIINVFFLVFLGFI